MISSCASQSDDDAWKEIVSEDGSYKILFPDNPSKIIKQGQTQAGKVIYPKYELYQPNTYFSVLKAEVDVSKENLKSYYDNMSQQTIKLNNHTLMIEKDIWQNKNLGRELKATSQNTQFTSRFYLINNKFCQVSARVNVSVKDDAKTQEQVNKFLDSFEIIEKESN